MKRSLWSFTIDDWLLIIGRRWMGIWTSWEVGASSLRRGSGQAWRRRLNGGVGDLGIIGMGLLGEAGWFDGVCLAWGFSWRRSWRFCSSWVVLYRLFSSRRSYISRRSRTFSFAKSFSANRPRVRAGSWDLGLRVRNLARAGNGGCLLSSSIASIVWFWIRDARSRRHERLTMRSARMDSIGVWGASSASRESRWRSKSSWVSVVITSWAADRPCFRAFWATAALPFWVFGPVDFWAFRRFAWIWGWVDMIFGLLIMYGSLV